METDNKNDKWWYRLSVFLYYFCLISAVLFSFGIAADLYITKEWLPLINSERLLFFSLSTLISIFIIEVVRRTSIYIALGRNFFEKKFPKFFLVLVIISLVSLGAGLLMKYATEPSLEGKWKMMQKEKDMQELSSLQVKFEEQRTEAKACLEETQIVQYEKDKEMCDAKYRREKMGYDSCMMYGWRTMCLQGNDYEVIDCSEESLKKPPESFMQVCALDALATKRQIDSLQEKIDSDY